MTDERDDAINDENPFRTGGEDADTPPQASVPGSGSEHAGIPLEDDAPEPEPQPQGDPCPKCGAPMKADQLVCMRCGYNLRDLKAAATKVIRTPVEVDDEELATAERRPLVRPFWFDPWLPIGIAAASGLILIIGYLAGAQGLFNLAVAEAIDAGQAIPSPEWTDRFGAVARFFVLTAIWTGCGVAGLFLLAQVLGRALGELAPALLRMLAIVAAMRLVTFIGFNSPRLEWLVEFALQAGVFYALTLALFKLSPRNAAIVSFSALLAFFALWLSGIAIAWVTGY